MIDLGIKLFDSLFFSLDINLYFWLNFMLRLNF